MAFVVVGCFAGAWAVATVDIERTFHLTDTGLGALLAAGIIAATAITAIGGAVTDRFGAGRSLTIALLAWGSLLVLEGLAPRSRVVRARARCSRWPRAVSSTS